MSNSDGGGEWRPQQQEQQYEPPGVRIRRAAKALRPFSPAVVGQDSAELDKALAALLNDARDGEIEALLRANQQTSRWLDLYLSTSESAFSRYEFERHGGDWYVRQVQPPAERQQYQQGEDRPYEAGIKTGTYHSGQQQQQQQQQQQGDRATYAAPPGQPGPSAAPKYECPHGDYTWYQRSVGTPVPNCPTHGVALVWTP